MSILTRWIRQPQSVWLRKALFQVHLWTGIGVGLYILAVSVSGSAIVFRVELANYFLTKSRTVEISGERLTKEQVQEAAARAYPSRQVASVFVPRAPDRAAEVWFEPVEGSTRRSGRLFDSYTGRDMANIQPMGVRVVDWLIDLHDNLLGDTTGRKVNGVGAILLTLLCLTGAIIWWPGIRNWRHSLAPRFGTNWRQLNWDLHSAIGFWMFLFVFMWAITGVYIVFQQSFGGVIDYFEPYNELSDEPRVGDQIARWLVRIHFGRAYGLTVKVLWVVLGLAPALLFVTGALMWWNRVLRKWLTALVAKPARRRGRRAAGVEIAG